MKVSAFGRLRDAAVAARRFFGRLGLRGWVTLVVLSAVSAALPVGITVVYGAGPHDWFFRLLSWEPSGTVGTVPEVPVFPRALAVVGLPALYLHSVAETAFVRGLRGGGEGLVRSFAVGGRLFAVRTGTLVALLAIPVLVGLAVRRVVADPSFFSPTVLLVVLIPVVLAVDALTVDAAVPVVLADREPERHVDRPDPPGSPERGSESWWHQQMAAELDDRLAVPASSGVSWSEFRDHLGPRGVLSAWGDLWRRARRETGGFLAGLVVRLVLEFAVWVGTVVGFYAFLLVAGIVGVVLLVVASLLGEAGLLLALLLFLVATPLVLALLAVVTALVHAPLRAFARYYGLLVFGDLGPGVDAVPERRAAFRIRRETDGDVGSTDRGLGDEGTGDPRGTGE